MQVPEGSRAASPMTVLQRGLSDGQSFRPDEREGSLFISCWISSKRWGRVILSHCTAWSGTSCRDGKIGRCSSFHRLMTGSQNAVPVMNLTHLRPSVPSNSQLANKLTFLQILLYIRHSFMHFTCMNSVHITHL